MRISGFSMVRNATKLHYPIVESIRSILPIVDEFVVAVGKGSEGDRTKELISSIDSEKVRVIDTVWDTTAFPDGTENAHQTDIAASHCTGDWLFYLQADEVVHEKDHEQIRQACEKYLEDDRVEGFLFDYIHFWGDFDRYLNAHGWYPEEIRIVRNDPEIHSWRSAQSFRRIPDFDGKSYRQVEGTYKLQVVKLEATIHHYGWVRPPRLMDRKKKALDAIHGNRSGGEEEELFDYGDLERLPRFQDSHPGVMKEWIDRTRAEMGEREPSKKRPKHKHETLKNRLITLVEQKLLGGRKLFRRKNWVLIGKEKRQEAKP